MPAEERRINIRVSPEEFDRMDTKRFAEKRSFQEIGLGLFRAWLRDEQKPVPVPDGDKDPDFERLRYVKEHGQIRHVESLEGNIRAFHELAIVDPREPQRVRKKKAG